MGVFSDFKNLFNGKTISLFTWTYLYCFLYPLDFNFFICSYLRTQLFIIEHNMLSLISLLLCYLIYLLVKKLKINNTNLKNFLKFNYLNFLIKINNYNIFYFFSNIFNVNFKNIAYIYYNNYLNLILFIYNYIQNNFLLWYPIYKSYSIFGFYKSTRLKFIDIKNENLKNLKY